jgi:hypothetical protein
LLQQTKNITITAKHSTKEISDNSSNNTSTSEKSATLSPIERYRIKKKEIQREKEEEKQTKNNFGNDGFISPKSTKKIQQNNVTPVTPKSKEEFLKELKQPLKTKSSGNNEKPVGNRFEPVIIDGDDEFLKSSVMSPIHSLRKNDAEAEWKTPKKFSRNLTPTSNDNLKQSIAPKKSPYNLIELPKDDLNFTPVGNKPKVSLKKQLSPKDLKLDEEFEVVEVDQLAQVKKQIQTEKEEAIRIKKTDESEDESYYDELLKESKVKYHEVSIEIYLFNVFIYFDSNSKCDFVKLLSVFDFILDF